MPKKTIVPLLAASFGVLNKISPNLKAIETVSPDTASDLHRIADALERIATSLEKLTGEDDDSSAGAVEQVEEKKWITLPDTSSEITILHQYLSERGVTIREAITKPTLEEKTYQRLLELLALYLGQNFEVCQEIYKKLRSNMATPPKKFSHSLKDTTEEQFRLIREFCRLLKEADLLEESTHENISETNVELKPSGREQKFLSGAWLESYVLLEVERIVQPYSIRTRQSYKALARVCTFLE